MPSSSRHFQSKKVSASTTTQMRKFLDLSAKYTPAAVSKSSTTGTKSSKSSVVSKDLPESSANSSSSGEKCDACSRVFRDADHLAKHRRGALCRRLLQRVARKHRKMALAEQQGNAADRRLCKGPLETQQPSAEATALPASSSLKRRPRNSSINGGSGGLTGSGLVYKPYQCTVCGARFYDKVNVELHLQRQHNTQQQLWVEVAKMRDVTLVPATAPPPSPITAAIGTNNNNLCGNVTGEGSNSIIGVTGDVIGSNVSGLSVSNVIAGDVPSITAANNANSNILPNSVNNIGALSSDGVGVTNDVVSGGPCINNISAVTIRNSVDGSSSSSSPYTINSSSINCLDISNNNSSRLFSNDRLKCVECNSLFQSEAELSEHKRLMHHNSALPHALLQQLPGRGLSYGESSTGLPAGSMSHAPPPITAHSNNNNTKMVSRMDGSLSAINQQLLPPGYIFPSTPYYGNDSSTSMQQTSVLHHTHPSYLHQPPHPHHQHPQHQQQVLHHHSQLHNQQQQQHHEQQQELVLGQQPHNSLLQTHHHLQQQQQLNHHHHHLHHHQQQHQQQQLGGVHHGVSQLHHHTQQQQQQLLQQSHHGSLPGAATQFGVMSGPAEHPAAVQLGPAVTGPPPPHHSTALITSSAHAVLLNNSISAASSSSTLTNNSLSVTAGTTTTNNTSSNNISTNSNNLNLNNMSSAASSFHSNDSFPTRASSESVTNVAATSSSAASSTTSTTTSSSTASSSNGRSRSLERPAAVATATSGNTKWNMCGDCGIKFLDLMNLELHVERRHPKLKILGSVDLGLGTMCYKTGVVNVNGGGSSRSSLTKELAKESKVSQRHTCSLCSHRTTSLVPMVDHMLNVHFLTGKSMMDAIVSEGETGLPAPPDRIHMEHTQQQQQVLNSAIQYPQQQQHSTAITNPQQPAVEQTPSHGRTISKSQRSSKEHSSSKNGISVSSKEESSSRGHATNQCHSCQTCFRSSSELIRHRIKDKRYTCVVCCYVTCSRRELGEHMRAEHDWNQFTLATPDTAAPEVKKKLTCGRCGQEFKKTGEFIEHLKGHGSLAAKCEKCGKQDYNIANILIHMTTLHSDYMNKLIISLTAKGKTWTYTYLQTLTGDLVDTSVLKVSKPANGLPSTAASVDDDIKTNEQEGTRGMKTRPKNKKRSLDLSKSKRLTKDRSNAGSSAAAAAADDEAGSSKTSSSAGADGEKPKAYACSQCRVCLYGTTNLEAHLRKHQQSLCNYSSTGDTSSLSCLDLLGATTIKRSPSEDGMSPPPSGLSSPSSSVHGAGSGGEQVVGLEPLAKTGGFQCEECGLTRNTSDLLISHIQKVHISGNLIHIIMEDDNTVKNYPIYIVTPISSN